MSTRSTSNRYIQHHLQKEFQMDSQNRAHPYQRLSPDVWSECLSYLPPNELSDAFELLPLSTLRNVEMGGSNCNKDVEHAAWLSILSMVEIANKYWETEAIKSDLLPISSSMENSSIHDAKALQLQRLVSNDTSIVGDLFRNQKQSKQNNKSQFHHQLTRFKDETWQDLYGFLYSVVWETEFVLDEGDGQDISQEVTMAREQEEDPARTPEVVREEFYDHEGIALAVALIFGIRPTHTPMNPTRYKKMGCVARASSNIACESKIFKETHSLHVRNHYKSCYSPTEARSYAISLRMAQEGFWDHASDILHSKISSFEGNNDSTESLLSIDGMIYISTFLIDQLYSQTYVKTGGQDDKRLATAVRLGRKAVTMAETRYKSFREANATTTESIVSTMPLTSTKSNRVLPPPPMESLFANDALRYIHAKLALGKALSLLSQHVGLMATDFVQMESEYGIKPIAVDDSLFQEPFPLNFIPEASELMLSEQKRLWAQSRGTRRGRQWLAWTALFFEESRVHLKEGLDACQDYSRRQNDKSKATGDELVALRAGLESAEGERMYCCASAATASRTYWTMLYYFESSINAFSCAFHRMMNELVGHIITAKHDPNEERRIDRIYVDASLDCLLKCGKDFGKTCGFGKGYGVNYREHSNGTQTGQQKLLDDKAVFDFVYLVSIHRYGSFHPTTENVERLANNVKSIDEIYANVVTWLSSEYGIR